MTIAERLQEVGRRKGKREGQHAEALRIAQRMLADGIARETVVKITRPDRRRDRRAGALITPGRPDGRPG